MKFSRLTTFSVLGIAASLFFWVLPTRLKPYHIKRDFDDFKILFIERNSEWGFAANGLIKVHTATAFAGTKEMLAAVRQDWIHRLSRSRARWPASSLRLHYDEWGPSRVTIEDNSRPAAGWLTGLPSLPVGLEVTQQGEVYCLPYSVLAILFALPLIWKWMFNVKARRETPELRQPSLQHSE